MFKKVLVANRGEIAVRVLRACEERGYCCGGGFLRGRSIGVACALCRRGLLYWAAPSRESYLRIDNIIDVARKSGADAIHPGYGFLSENAEFAAACAEMPALPLLAPAPKRLRRWGTKFRPVRPLPRQMSRLCRVRPPVE